MNLSRVLGFIAFLFGSVYSSNNFKSVYTKSGLGQLVTSSSLRWEYAKRPRDWIKDSRTVISGDVAACKGTFKGNPVIGSARRSNGVCYAEFNGNLHQLRSKFFVLIQRLGASKLVWKPWNIFTKIPISSVAFDLRNFVSRVGDKEDYSMGALDPRRGLSGEILVLDIRNGTFNAKEGDVLVEVEPIDYELRDIRYIKRRAKIIKREQIIFGQKTFINAGFSEGWNSVRSVMSYNTTYSYYWGQIFGLIKALPSKAPVFGDPDLENDFTLANFSWGLPLKMNKQELIEISKVLEGKTASKAEISGIKTTMEIPYKANLISIYSDGSETSIRIDGTYTETVVKDIRANFEQPYFINNGSLALTTTVGTTSTMPDSSTEIFKAKNPRFAPNTSPKPRKQPSSFSQPDKQNPLLRFYPPDDSDMMSDQARFPVTESLRNEGTLATSLPYLFYVIAVLFGLGTSRMS